MRLLRGTRESEFIFDGIDVLYYHFNKISLNGGGSDRIFFVQLSIDDDKYFLYAVIVALNREQI